ncbi:hypothetical protein E2C01_029190 [Portunus trituberculatus]|uniref:Uncharacterized protein n=1 Tax=Portunus trituberculatus TaxID=210409 RepID=A0A5B7ERB1_PORTR|nr:hypothetical protein [Portunus trituberculatus]
MRRGWRFSSCGTAMEVEPLKAGILLVNEVVVVVLVVLVPEVEATVVLLSRELDKASQEAENEDEEEEPVRGLDIKT